LECSIPYTSELYLRGPTSKGTEREEGRKGNGRGKGKKEKGRSGVGEGKDRRGGMEGRRGEGICRTNVKVLPTRL